MISFKTFITEMRNLNPSNITRYRATKTRGFELTKDERRKAVEAQLKANDKLYGPGGALEKKKT